MASQRAILADVGVVNLPQQAQGMSELAQSPSGLSLQTRRCLHNVEQQKQRLKGISIKYELIKRRRKTKQRSEGEVIEMR